MQTRFLAALVTSILLLGIASAQEYSIRADRGLNLRAAPSLNADIADTVPTGSVLQVVGKSGSWLKINRSGNEVWLADWVNFSRVDGSESTPSPQPAAPIDNCCFVDRQCQSDQEWTDGYWAFQHGQCPAPAQTQPATPAQPVVSKPLTGGNCCSPNWPCYADEDRVRGSWVYQLNQCAGLPQTARVTLTGPVPRIEGSSRFVEHITATLKFMKSVAPDWYNYVITGMDTIAEVHSSSDGYCYARAYNHDRRVALESCWVDWSSEITGVIEFDQADTAAALGHEACHIHSHYEGRLFANHEHEEAECRKFGTGAKVLLGSALTIGLNPGRGTYYFYKDQALDLLRSYCSQGYRADLFCPTLQRLEEVWRNVPFGIFPPEPVYPRVPLES